MSKIDVTMNSVYDSGKIRGYATAVIDDNISIRGIKVEQDGLDDFEVNISMPNRQNIAILSLFNDEFTSQLKSEVFNTYCNSIGVDMTVADPIENSSCNTKKMDVLMTKMFHEGERGSLKALSNVSIDDSFSINRVEVREMDDGVLEVQMPQRKTVDGFKEICSLVGQTYEKKFKDAVLEGYFQKLELIEVMTEERTAPLLEMPADAQEEAQSEQELDEEAQDFSMGGMSDG
ncbi:MAG: septation protein SpoVG family protein [Eubacteriales bacterium]